MTAGDPIVFVMDDDHRVREADGTCALPVGAIQGRVSRPAKPATRSF
jgi:hypothetical protein